MEKSPKIGWLGPIARYSSGYFSFGRWQSSTTVGCRAERGPSFKTCQWAFYDFLLECPIKQWDKFTIYTI